MSTRKRPNFAEWQYAIRVLQRQARELAGEGPGAAILERCAAHMLIISPPRPPTRRRDQHVRKLIGDALKLARGEDV